LEQVFLSLVGGLGIFLFGMYYTSQGLQQLSAGRLQTILARVTQNRFLALGVGILLTLLLQSSSAATVLLVGFVSARLISLERGLIVVLGAAVGTTLTVQIIAFNLAEYALLLIGLGVIPLVFSTRNNLKQAGQILVGFGLVFFGMGLLSQSLAPLASDPAFAAFLAQLDKWPLAALLAATVFTAIIQSSAATVALAMSLATQGIISLPAAIPLILGANVGTTATALLSSLASSRDAKRLALGHFFVKAGGAALFIFLTQPFGQLVALSAVEPARQVANAHTLFNLINALLFWPVIGSLAKFLERMLPGEKEERRAEFLDRRVLEVPDLALQQARNELGRMVKILEDDLLPGLLRLVRQGSDQDLNYNLEKEKTIDFLYRAVTSYLSQMARGNLSERQAEEEVLLLYVANDLEHMGDVVVATGEIGRKLWRDNLSFSDEGWNELEEMYDQVLAEVHRAFRAFMEDDPELAVKVLKGQAEMAGLEKDLRYSHFRRVQADNSRSLESSSYHLDLVNNLFRLHGHAVSIAQTVLGII